MSASRVSPTSPMSVSLFIAAAVHIVAIFSIGFSIAMRSGASTNSVEVVMLQTQTNDKPEQAQRIAQANQKASGHTDRANRPTSPVTGRSPRRSAGIAPISQRAAALAKPAQAKHMVLTQKAADRQIHSDRRSELDKRSHPRAYSSVNRRAMKLAQLVSELDQDQRRYAKRPRINYIDSVSATSAVEAAYLKGWVNKVERIGNLNYPDEARRHRLSGRLILNVLLNHTGNIVKAEVSVPSGRQVLDDAALRIAKLAAPYPKFSAKMRAKYDQLMITRTWVFKADNHLQTR